MDAQKLRAWWFHRQGLDGSRRNSGIAEVLDSTGWARSVGGAAPYLSIFARNRSSREAMDSAVAQLEIHELPAARGCTYVVPAADFAFALAAAEPFSGAEFKVASKLGVTEQEIGKLSDAVIRALAKGPLDPEEIRQATGNAARGLGEEGKKKGVTTTLPVALGKLQVEGRIRRIPINGRLDQQRYKYCLWDPNPRANFSLPGEEAAAELARRYFRWIGPATLAEFQWFSALSAKAAKAAVASLQLEPLEKDQPLLIRPEDRDAFEEYRAPRQPQYALVASLDGITLLKRNLRELLDDADLQKPVFAAKPYATAGLTDLPSHAILDRGRLVGLWEFDTESRSIAWTAFVEKTRELKQAVAEMEEFVGNQLGDARSYSLDSPPSRKPRIAALRAAQ